AGRENGDLFPLRGWPWGRRFVPPAVLAVRTAICSCAGQGRRTAICSGAGQGRRTAICSPCGAGRGDGDLFPLWGWP
ncbi:TPA: hypothetical protein ACPT5Y_004382, partial [Escherichia coli]